MKEAKEGREASYVESYHEQENADAGHGSGMHHAVSVGWRKKEKTGKEEKGGIERIRNRNRSGKNLGCERKGSGGREEWEGSGDVSG